MSRKAKDEARKARLTERRRDVERRLYSLRDALDDEVGYAPRGRGATLLLLATCAGVALGLRGKARKEGKLRRGGDYDGDPLGDL
jgi:hypothetical protein